MNRQAKSVRGLGRWLVGRRMTTAVGWAALGTLLLSSLLGIWGYVTLTAQPQHTVQITVDEGLPWQITQATVDAAMADSPVRSWEPVTLRVTDQYFTTAQQRQQEGTEGFGADLILSVHPDPLSSGLSSREETNSGVAAHPEMPTFWRDYGGPADEVARLYRANLGVGQGPSGVVAAARHIGELTYSGAPRVPAAWIAWTGGTAAAALLLGTVWVRLHRRDAEVRRAFQRGQADLARVLLEEDALALTLVAVPPQQQKPHPGFQRLRRQVTEGTTPLVRREQKIADGLASTEREAWSTAARDVPGFTAQARLLAEQTEALLAAGEVLTGSRTGQGVLDRVADPLVTAARSLQARLRTAPPGTVQPGRLDELDEAVLALLAVVQKEALSDAPGISASGRRDWDRAERRLTGVARSIRSDLERFPLGRTAEREPSHTSSDTQLRNGLGLTLRQDGGAGRALAQTQAVATALLGEPEGAMSAPTSSAVRSDTGDSPATRGGGQWWKRWRGSGTVIAAGMLRRGGGAGVQGLRLTGRGWLMATLLSLVIAQPLAGAWAERATPHQSWDLQGREAIRSLVVDGPNLGISPERVLDRIDGSFPEQLDVVVAVRAAEAYVTPEPVDGELHPGDVVHAEVHSVIEGAQRIRAEFPERIDPDTGELLTGQVIVPILVWEDGRRSMMDTQLPRPLVGGHAFSGGNPGLLTGVEAVSLDGRVASALADVARDLQTDPADLVEDLSEESLRLLLTLMLTVLILALVALVESFASFAWGLRGIGSLSRSGRRLRTVRRELGQLLLELDRTRLDRVAVLGAGPAGSPQEAEQRLYERALASAWCDTEDLGNLTIGQRLRGQAEPRLERLEQAVALLQDRDSDVADRAARVLSLAR